MSSNDGSSSSGNCSCSADTMSTPFLGIRVLQLQDFFQSASILHPLAIGSIVIIVLFVALRLSSNRSIAPMNLFDWLVNVALGSTLAGIVNGNSLARGVIGLAVLLFFQWSYLSSHSGPRVRHILNSPPLVIIFRGRTLDKVMMRHRISMVDLNGALRQAKVANVSEVEVCVLEPTGAFVIYKTVDLPDNMTPDVLLAVPAYKALVDELESGNEKRKRNAKELTKQGDVPRLGARDLSHIPHGMPNGKPGQHQAPVTPTSHSSTSADSDSAQTLRDDAGKTKAERTNIKQAKEEEAAERRENEDGQGECELGTEIQNEIAQKQS